MRRLLLLVLALLLSACATRDLPPNGIVEPEGRWFVEISNEKSEKLFDVRSPIGRWRWWDRTKRKGTKYFGYFYEGPNSGMINAEIRISFSESTRPRTLEEQRNETRVSEQERRLKILTTKPNFLSTFRPRNLVTEIRQVSGLKCGYFSYDNHTGPKLDSVVKEFRGMGSFRREEWYRCPVMRDGRLWFLGIDIIYQYSDLIAKNNLDISLPETIDNFDRMIAPTLKSLRLYGELEQFDGPSSSPSPTWIPIWKTPPS